MFYLGPNEEQLRARPRSGVTSCLELRGKGRWGRPIRAGSWVSRRAWGEDHDDEADDEDELDGKREGERRDATGVEKDGRARKHVGSLRLEAEPGRGTERLVRPGDASATQLPHRENEHDEDEHCDRQDCDRRRAKGSLAGRLAEHRADLL